MDLDGALSIASLLFSESPSRIIISFDESSQSVIEQIALRQNCPFTKIGHVKGDRLRLRANGEDAIDAGIAELESVWRNSLSQKLRPEAMAASIE